MIPQDLAAQFRERHGKVGAGGVVVLYDGEACGWVDKLRNPEHWRHGALAVEEDGTMWVAKASLTVGGEPVTSDDTAYEWVICVPGAGAEAFFKPVVKRGRPVSGSAKTGAQRQAAYKARKAAEGKTAITVMVDQEVASALAAYVERQNADKADQLVTLGEAVERILRDRLLRKR